MRYSEIGWQRTSLTNGDPLAKPHMHLTTDGERTCCGVKIPRIGAETQRYRIDEIYFGLDCERCFTDERKEKVL